ncbi:uncharacterized protein LOC121923287 isoform X2 [Sceloporus undulatus]|uniref:uncharacterized protein LOC121923287 isoform X2 n=1 Tax=Sceloporus undulatus TaxID=8520 RepID=UPI001C4C7596|nr:uncharacterized protein LOC121923287 isoform X2 [Sceloporus undulatus]
MLSRLYRFCRRKSRKVARAPMSIPGSPENTPGNEGNWTPTRPRQWFCRGCQRPHLLCKKPVGHHFADPQTLMDKLQWILEERASALEGVQCSWPLPTLQSERNLPLNLTGIAVMMKKINKRKQEKLDFLRALSASCTEALEKGCNDLGLPHKKDELVEAIVVVMESLPVTAMPTPVLSCAMLALYHLSKFQPSLDRDLESHVLRLVLYYVFTMESTAVRSQDFCISSCLTLEVLLEGLLAGDATSAHLLFLIKHINFWLESSGNKEKMRALTCASALIGHAIYVLGPKTSEKHPEWGSLVCQYKLHVASSNPVVSQAAREVLSSLYKFFLHQRGLSQILSKDLWCQEDCGTEMLGYIDTCMAAEAFSEILNQAQKAEMIKTAWLASYNFWLTTSVPGILILYALVGKADVFLLDKNSLCIREPQMPSIACRKRKRSQGYWKSSCMPKMMMCLKILSTELSVRTHPLESDNLDTESHAQELNSSQ